MLNSLWSAFMNYSLAGKVVGRLQHGKLKSIAFLTLIILVYNLLNFSWNAYYLEGNYNKVVIIEQKATKSNRKKVFANKNLHK